VAEGRDPRATSRSFWLWPMTKLLPPGGLERDMAVWYSLERVHRFGRRAVACK
jgi:hypothetical protein